MPYNDDGSFDSVDWFGDDRRNDTPEPFPDSSCDHSFDYDTCTQCGFVLPEVPELDLDEIDDIEP